MLVDPWYPEGTSFAANEEVTKRVEARILGLEGVEGVTTWVGSGAERFVLVLDQIFPQTNASQMIVMPRDMKAREKLRTALPALLATEFPEVRARAKLLPNGPPVAYPVQFRVVGPEASHVRAYADEVKAIMRANPNLRGINDNWNESVKTLHLDIDQDRRAPSASPAPGLSQAARIVNGGNNIGQYRDGDKLIDIVLPAAKRRAAIADLATATCYRQRTCRSTRSRPHALPGSRACSGAIPGTTPPRCRATSSRACRARP